MNQEHAALGAGRREEGLRAENLLPEDAFKKLLPEIEAVPLSELNPVNLDLRAVVITVLGVDRHLDPYREAMARLPVDIEAINKPTEYALALARTQTLVSIDEIPANHLAEQAKQVRILRARLLSDATALTHRGLLDGKALKELHGTTVSTSSAFDLLALSALFIQHWPAIANKTGVPLEELEGASALGMAFIESYGKRACAPRDPSRSSQLRAKAFTLLVHAYSEVRSALAFILRKDGGADQIVPSLYSRRAGAKRRRTELNAVPAPEVMPAPSYQPTLETQPNPAPVETTTAAPLAQAPLPESLPNDEPGRQKPLLAAAASPAGQSPALPAESATRRTSRAKKLRAGSRRTGRGARHERGKGYGEVLKGVDRANCGWAEEKAERTGRNALPPRERNVPTESGRPRDLPSPPRPPSRCHPRKRDRASGPGPRPS